MKTKIYIYFAIILTIGSCKKTSDFSTIPVVEYESAIAYTTAETNLQYIEISVKFTDGDGDLCFYETDTIKNMIFDLYYVENDSLIKADLEVPLDFKIPYYEPEGKNKFMTGSIKTKFYIDEFKLLYDTIKLNFYVFDRAYNKSNISSTPYFILNNY